MYYDKVGIIGYQECLCAFTFAQSKLTAYTIEHFLFTINHKITTFTRDTNVWPSEVCSSKMHSVDS